MVLSEVRVHYLYGGSLIYYQGILPFGDLSWGSPILVDPHMSMG